MTTTDTGPQTEAGRDLIAALPPTWWPVADGTFARKVRAIEAEDRSVPPSEPPDAAPVSPRPTAHTFDQVNWENAESETRIGALQEMVAILLNELDARPAEPLDVPTCIECGEPWPCDATVTRAKDGIPHRLGGPKPTPLLDVSLLRQALERTGYTLWDNDAGYPVVESDVANLAAEYARLAQQDGTGE